MSLIANIFKEHLSAVDTLRGQEDRIFRLGNILIERLHAGGRILLCGNGGSAADAQHIATELTCRFEINRRALPAIALTTDTSMLTACGNDLGFDRIFSRQIEAIATSEDVLVGISTSGQSANVINAVIAARQRGTLTVGLLGRDGGAMHELVDHGITVGVNSTARIQECHILIGHIWCAMIDAAFTDAN